MLIGIFCVIFNVVSLVMSSTMSSMRFAYVGHGFWCGTLFIVTGSIGVAAGHRKTKCKIVAYNVMSIISVVFTSGLLVCGVLGAVLTSYEAINCNSYSSTNDENDFCYRVQVVVTMESFLAVFAVIEAILFILTSCICCKHGGCGNCCSDVDRPVLLPIACQQNTGQLLQGLQLAYFTTTPFQEGPTAALSSTPSTWNQLQSPSVAPLAPTAPAPAPAVDSGFRSGSTPLYPQVDDGPIYDNYGIN